MNWKFGNVPDWILLLLTGIALVFFVALEKSKAPRKDRYYELKLEASSLDLRAMTALKKKRIELGVPIDPFNDPNSTGLIGHPFSLITTKRGDLTSKWTSLNPNFAALCVEDLKKLHLKEGDHVAVAFTGSFPGINIAVLSALKTLKLKPVIITSLGSSSFGANDQRFTWLDMESALFKANIFPWRSAAASLGGEDDIARELSPEGRKLLEDAVERNGMRYLKPKNLNESIEKRLEIYRKELGDSIRAFINVGAGEASLGRITFESKEIPFGILKRHDMFRFPHSLMREMAQIGVPAINYLNIQEIAKKEGLKIAPLPLPPPGEGKLFIREKYSVALASILSVVLAFLLFFVVRFDLSKFLSQRRS